MRRIWLGALWAGALTCPVRPRAVAQTQTPVTSYPGVETDLAGALSRLAVRAPLIFVGTVQGIERTSTAVEITLRVEEVLQGNPGSRYVLREWAGRWPPGLERYTVGQRSLFFLQAPGPSGLSSPVDGGDGVVPVWGDLAAGGATLDVSRLNTRLLRRMGDPLSNVNTVSFQAAAQTIGNALRPGLRRPANPSGEQPVPIIREGRTGTRSVEAPGGK